MIPKIDPDVKYIGSSKLRELTAIELRALTGAIVVTGAQNTPLAVILPYQTYLRMQNAVEGVRRFTEPLMSREEAMSKGSLDAYGPELSSGQGKATTETFRRGPRQKGDTKR